MVFLRLFPQYVAMTLVTFCTAETKILVFSSSSGSDGHQRKHGNAIGRSFRLKFDGEDPRMQVTAEKMICSFLLDTLNPDAEAANRFAGFEYSELHPVCH